jgi:hypothetical protein
MKKLLITIAILIVLPGCATPRQYEWNSYDAGLYRYYKEPASAEAFRTSMEQHLKSLDEKKQRPAPGLYAELGTLYLERGDRLTAATYYRKERDAWPESRHLMDAMLSNLDKMKKGAGTK